MAIEVPCSIQCADDENIPVAAEGCVAKESQPSTSPPCSNDGDSPPMHSKKESTAPQMSTSPNTEDLSITVKENIDGPQESVVLRNQEDVAVAAEGSAEPQTSTANPNPDDGSVPETAQYNDGNNPRPSTPVEFDENTQNDDGQDESTPAPSDEEKNWANGPEASNSQENVPTNNYTFEVENFSDRREVWIESAPFTVRSNDTHKWRLKIYPRGIDEESEEFVSVYLVPDNGEEEAATARFKLAVIDDENEHAEIIDSRKAFKFHNGDDLGYKKFIRREVLLDQENRMLTNGNLLRIYCEVEVEDKQLGNEKYIIRNEIAAC